ncbi:extracellular solute-binding protein [Thermaerobacter sp. PB12/4term]|uniref:sugar ABC transporter substrate-binding protein n=1 Tax=Thermaerobacter sp. PB12/4term TaxID=2293838 RepID=UPI000E327ACA|nr:extracellular solute-binding protein [Thermaerobacter sp. PB12/4term]QIA27768.1 extracellular solute-binding protein [Thermaerobacter sp. PB12/4term]
MLDRWTNGVIGCMGRLARSRALRRALAAALVAGLLVLAGCGGSGGQPAAGDQAAGGAGSSGGEQGVQTVTLRAMTIGKPTERYRFDNLKDAVERLNQKLEQEGANVRVQLEGTHEDRPWDEYKQRFILAAEAGKAPDIILSGHEDVAPWAAAGHIVPLDEYVKDSPVYRDVFPTLWESVTLDGKIWGIPQDTEARPLYFWKSHLKQLGWTDQQIAQLPERIRSGDFTLDDLLDLAKQLQDRGIVPAGQGFWTRPQPGVDFYMFYLAYDGRMQDPATGKLVLDQEALLKEYRFFARARELGVLKPSLLGTDWSIWHRTVTGKQVGLFVGGSWQVAEWQDQYGLTDADVQDLGYALLPAGEKGKPGVTLSHPLVYMVTKYSQHPDLAARLILEATNPEFNTRHAVESNHLAILKSQLEQPEYKENRLLGDLAYMVEYAGFVPLHAQFGNYDQAIYRGLSAVVAGQMTPEQAVDTVVKQLQAQLRDEVIIR